MATSNSTPRIVVTMPDGTTIAADTPEHLTAAIVAVRRASDAMSITTLPRATRTRRPKDPSEGAQQVLGTRWTVGTVQKLLDTVTAAASKMLRTAATMPTPITVTAMSERLKTRAGGIGPLIGKLGRDAQAIAPGLPLPLQTDGRIGSKSLVFDPAFFEALKEVVTSTH